MRHATVLELADEQGIWLPEALTAEWPPGLSAADEKGWFRFQRLYDIARSVVTTEAAVRRLLLEAAEDEAAEGSRWLEIQVDPSGYAAHFGGITAFTDLVLDAARDATDATGVSMSQSLIAANRTRHPLDARTLARLAAQYAGRGVVGFGLSNDERRGEALAFAKAFDIAERAGLLADPARRRAAAAPRASGPASTAWARTGSATASARSRIPTLVAHLADAGVTLEVCPQSNVALGSIPTWRPCRCASCSMPACRIALGADDPLLFDSRLVAQYEAARDVHGFTDAELAELARMSIRGSAAPDDVRSSLLADIDAWLTRLPDPSTPDHYGQSEGAVDQGGFGVEVDAEGALHAVADLAREVEQLHGRGVAAVGQGKGVLGRQPGPTDAVALG